MNIRKLIRLSMLLLISTLLSGCDHQERLLKVGTNVWPGYEMLYLAQKKGFVDEHKVRLVELLSATDVMEAFVNKNIDAATLTLDEVMFLKAKGIDLKVLLIMDFSEGADTLIAKKGIESLEQLQGKTICYEPTAVGAVMMDGFLKESGLSLSDVNTIHLTVDEHEDAFRQGKADAVVTFEPVTTALKALGGNVLFDSSDIPGRIVDVLVIHTDLIPAHEQGLLHLIKGHFKTLEYWQKQNNKKEGAELMSARMKLEPREVIESFNGLKLPDLKTNQDMFAGENSKIRRSAEKLNSILLSSDLIQEKVDTSGLFESGYIFKAGKL